MVLSAYGTAVYSRSQWRPPLSLTRQRKRGKERRPERAQLRCALDRREPNDIAVCLSPHSVRLDGFLSPSSTSAAQHQHQI